MSRALAAAAALLVVPSRAFLFFHDLVPQSVEERGKFIEKRHKSPRRTGSKGTAVHS